MRTLTLPGTSIAAPAVISGMMRIQELSNEEIRSLYDAARESGVNFFDPADIYGDPTHACEARFGDALHVSEADSVTIMIQT